MHPATDGFPDALALSYVKRSAYMHIFTIVFNFGADSRTLKIRTFFATLDWPHLNTTFVMPVNAFIALQPRVFKGSGYTERPISLDYFQSLTPK